MPLCSKMWCPLPSPPSRLTGLQMMIVLLPSHCLCVGCCSLGFLMQWNWS
uniref:Uncharacterized protein n=1 Tax=Anguilla anguilla TaxID=7936 RepID=A0A0E9T1X9_ANGAN